MDDKDIKYKAKFPNVFAPRLIVNNPDQGEKVLTDVIKELNDCDKFMFCVAFLTMSGYQVLLKTLLELEQKNILGTIIVSQYQNFTEPRALRKLLKLKNIDLRVVTDDVCKMHTKGYIFKKGEEYKIIVGSSNLTQNALCLNKEWNVQISSSENSDYAKMVIDEFKYMYTLSKPVDEDFIDSYEEKYEAIKNVQRLYVAPKTISNIVPNKMQEEALANLKLYRELGEKRALAVSSTGTGKTILCALDVKAYKPKKFLFIVHREQIAKDAMVTFKRVIGNDIDACLLGGGNVGNSKYIFSMIQTISRDEYLNFFSRDEFDYIVFDEAHRIGAPTYQKVFNYFQPKFVLGMTATPERGDGYNIFELFNYNLACDIRLQEAMKEDLICPFHYYAISDLVVDGELIDDKTMFNRLVCSDRVNHIINKIQTYGFNGDKVKGLVFVSSIEEAKKLSKAFNERGYRTKALSGENSQEEREQTIDLLESDDPLDSLDYIFTVDIFNEGIDIQKINQVVMLRPTQSAIIFVQQLGRGLRKHYSKEYLVVLDFVGNYDQNFLIPIALSGDYSYNKDNLRRFIKEGNKTIQGASTINFEKIVEKNIFEKLDKADFSQTKLIKDAYKNLKNKLGRIPTIFDFEKYDSIDVTKIFDKFGSYYNFLLHNEKEFIMRFSELEEKYLELLSKKYANGKKPHELECLTQIIAHNKVDLNEFSEFMKDNYPLIIYDSLAETNLLNQMIGEYLTGSDKVKFKDTLFASLSGETLIIHDSFSKVLLNSNFKKEVLDIINFGLRRYETRYSENYGGTPLKLYEKYTYDDVCRLLNWDKNEVSLNIGGYKYHKNTNTFPVFINYEKSEDISDSIKYEDEFLSPSEIIDISKNGRTLESADIKAIKNSQSNGTKIYLFVRKNKDDKSSKEFYFLGQITPTGLFEEFTMGVDKKAVKIGYRLESQVREDIYDYIVGD